MYDISPEELDTEYFDALEVFPWLTQEVDYYLDQYNKAEEFCQKKDLTREDIYFLIDKEREFQEAKHGPMNPKFGDRLAILVEEVGEVAKAGLNWDIENLKDELVQVAASAIKFLECLNGTEF